MYQKTYRKWVLSSFLTVAKDYGNDQWMSAGKLASRFAKLAMTDNGLGNSVRNAQVHYAAVINHKSEPSNGWQFWSFDDRVRAALNVLVDAGLAERKLVRTVNRRKYSYSTNGPVRKINHYVFRVFGGSYSQ